MKEYNQHEKGNPFKRGDTWTFIYYTKDKFGKRKQHWKGGYKTKAEAEKDLKIYKAKAVLSQLPSDETTTVKDWITEWFGVHKKQLQPNTVNGYNNNIQKYIIPYIGNVKLMNLKPSTLEKFYNDLEMDFHLSPKSIKYVHNVLKSALSAAVTDGIIEKNVCTMVSSPKVPKFNPVLLSKEQLSTLLNYVKGKRYETEIYLAVELGLRRGEVLGLKYEDFDFDKHTVTIQRQVSIVKDSTEEKYDGHYYGLKKLKSESSRRTLYVSESIEKIVRKKKLWYDLCKEKFGELFDDSGLVCCREDGAVLSPQTLYNAYKTMLVKCDLPNARFHDLRHSYATLCIDLNVPIKVLSQALGHSSSAVTDSVYADSITAKKKIADLVSDAVDTSEK